MEIKTNQSVQAGRLNFSQVRDSSAQLQSPDYTTLLTDSSDQPCSQVLTRVQDYKQDCARRQAMRAEESQGLGLLGAVAVAGGAWGALTAHPVAASVSGLAGLALALTSVKLGRESLEAARQQALSGRLQKDLESASRELADRLVTEGPGPDQFSNRCHYTGGILKSVVTTHARDSGACLKTKVEISGAAACRLEADAQTGMVTMTSAKAVQSFPGSVELEGTRLAILHRSPAGSESGPIRQIIHPDGSSQVRLSIRQGSNLQSLQIESAEVGKKQSFLPSSYCWDSGQLATYSNGRLYVAQPMLPFQWLSPSSMQVLPQGVVRSTSPVEGAEVAVECPLPHSFGVGTWSAVAVSQAPARLIETTFGQPPFRLSTDVKKGFLRAQAPDGSALESSATLVYSQGTYRIESSHAEGKLHQALLNSEVLLSLTSSDGEFCLQHKSGESPRAFQRVSEQIRELPVGLDPKGVYRIERGGPNLELTPTLPLAFLEKSRPT